MAVAGATFVGGPTHGGMMPFFCAAQEGTGGGDGARPPSCLHCVPFHTQVSEPTDTVEVPEPDTPLELFAIAKPPADPPKSSTVFEGPSPTAAPYRVLGCPATVS